MTTQDPDVYELPSLWGGLTDRSAQAWRERRAPQLVELFGQHIYGLTPAGGGLDAMAERSRDEQALGGIATKTEIDLVLRGPLGTKTVSMLVYRPNEATAPSPVLLGLNFKGNHTTIDDPEIAVSPAWVTGPVPSPRGFQARRWPFELAVARGYAVATIHLGELEEDRPGPSVVNGVRGLFNTLDELETEREPDAWGAIGAWAWGLSRALDAIEQLDGLDASRVIAHGHSRLGKTALWAAAQDQRFAAAISNDSGCAGASLARHHSGESVHMITRDFPHWFSPRYNDYRDAEENLPVDQHQLLAAILPRPVHVASASLDAHADPRGEFLSTVHASPIAHLFGGRGTVPVDSSDDICCADATANRTPAPGRRSGGLLSHHMREGEHDVLAEDWTHFMDFADENLGRPLAQIRRWTASRASPGGCDGKADEGGALVVR